MDGENATNDDVQNGPTENAEPLAAVNGVKSEDVQDESQLKENDSVNEPNRSENLEKVEGDNSVKEVLEGMVVGDNNIVKEEESIVNGITEAVKEENFLDNITLSTEVSDDTETGNKYNEEDATRRVLIKGINRKKSADDIEDYFFDNYADCGIEEVFACFVPGKKKWFNGAAILTFSTELQAQNFLKIELKKEEEIAFRQKLFRVSLAENKKRREARKNAETVKNEVTEVAEPNANAKDSRTIICTGFARTGRSLAEISIYAKENHENVVDVRNDPLNYKNILFTFTDQKAANRFLSLSYVKFKGVLILRKWGEDTVMRGEKRKLEKTDQRTGYLGAVKGAQFRLKGFKNVGTNYQAIKQALQQHGVDRKELKFISYSTENMEAVVRLQTALANTVVMKLNKSGFTVNGDKLVAQVMTGAEEDKYLEEVGNANSKWNLNKAKKINDWSDY